jgi:hypothetical protein
MPMNDVAPTNAQFDVFVPDAVRRAARRSEELQASLVEGSPPATPVGEPPASQPQAPVGEPPQQPPPQTDTWEQRYRTLQGKYDSEIPALRAQVGAMENLVRTMQAAPPQPPPAPAPPPPAPIPAEDIEAYGEDLIQANQRWAGAYLGPQIADLRRDLDQLRGGQQEITIGTMRERVHQGLSADPELAQVWQQMNGDTNFVNWLRQPDPLSGHVRYDMLQNAYNGGDAMRAGRFFKQYIAEHTASPYSPAPGSAQTPAQPYTNGHAPAAGNSRLADLVTPGRAAGAGGNGGGAPERRIWTNSQIKQFFDDKARGKWRHREDEALQLETDIFAASAEGRIRQ